MLKNTDEQFGSIAKFFHWIIALIVLAMIPFGFWMTGLEFSPEKLELYMLHKSFGMLVLMLAGLRILWRFSNKTPKHLSTHTSLEKFLAKVIHILLYIGIIGMPLSGWLMTSAGNYANVFFGLFDIPHILPQDQEQFKLLKDIHEYTAIALICGIGLHFIGAAKHHILDRDETLKRMAPGNRFMPNLIIIIGGCLLLLGSYMTYTEIRPASPTEQNTQTQIKKNTDKIKTAAPQKAAIRTWQIDKENSYIGFKASVQKKPFKGEFTGYNGSIHFDENNLEDSHVDITIKTAEVKTDNPDWSEYIGLAAWLHSTAYPTAKYKSLSFEKTTDGNFIARGQLTLRDVTAPLNIPFSLEYLQDNQIVRMRGKASFNRLDYNVGGQSWESPDTVAHEITVPIFIQATAAKTD